MKLKPIQIVETESRFSDVKYTLAGALYGFLIGNAFAISAAIVDWLLYPDLPLGFDWPLFAMRWGWIALGLGLVGAIAALFSDRLPSLLSGAVIAGFLALGSALYFSPVAAGMKVVVLIFALIPVAPMCLPVALILRWLVDKHGDVLELKQSIVRVIPLILLAILLGAGSGYFLKMSQRAVEATRFLHHLLQASPEDAKSPFRDLPGFQNHADMTYQLFQKPSETSTEGFDIRAEYGDGYRVNCVVVVYPGYDPYLSDCMSTQN